MKSGARVAVAVAAGYLLGRTKKMRLALMVAAAGATGSTSPRELLKRGIGQLSAVPELADLTDTVRTELLSAAKAAAVTAASGQINSLSGRLQDRITAKGSDDEDDAAVDEPEDEDEDRQPSGRKPKRRTAVVDDEQADDEQGDDEQADDEEPVDEPPRRQRTTRARSGSSTAPVRRGRR